MPFRQNHSPSLLQNLMQTLEWDSMGMKIGGRQIHHLRFADHVVLITPNFRLTDSVLVAFDNTCAKIDTRLNVTKIMFIKNGMVLIALSFSLNGMKIPKYSTNINLELEVDMINELASELHRKKRAASGAFRSVVGVVKRTKNILFHAHLSNSTIAPALTYVSES